MSAAPELHLEPDPCEASLAFLTQTVADLSEQIPQALEADASPDALVLLLQLLREQRMALASIEAFVEAETARCLGKGKATVAGFQVEVKGGSTWKDWRSDTLTWDLCQDIAVDPDTGELNEDVVPIIDMVRTRLLDAARPNWRTTVLARFGLKPSDYATWTEARRTVQITADAGETS